MEEIDALYLGCDSHSKKRTIPLDKYWHVNDIGKKVDCMQGSYNNKTLILIVDVDGDRVSIDQLFEQHANLHHYPVKVCIYTKSPSHITSVTASCFDAILFLPCESDEIYHCIQPLLPTKKAKNQSLLDAFVHLKLIGSSPVFTKTLKLIKQVSQCEAPVLIEGETGTGKENAARAIHYLGSRKDKAFVPINCGAIPDSLLESELFGYERGAFTDAKNKQQGLVEIANGGTLFLDEIDSLSFKAQTALLRFLQTGEYRALGSNKTKNSNVRIIAATNSSLISLVEKNDFREDLYFRLNVLYIRMPSLRERPDDIQHIARYFFQKYIASYDQGPRVIHEETFKWLRRQSWKGNVRELENILLREFLLCTSPKLLIEEKIPYAISDDCLACVDNNPITFQSAKETVINEFEKAYLSNILSLTKGNVSEAARIAGKERRAFGKLVKKYNIDKAQFSTSKLANKTLSA